MILIGSGHSRLDAGVIFSETEAPVRARASFPKWFLKAGPQQQQLPLDTSSQCTPRRPYQRGHQTQERRCRSRLPRHPVKFVKAQLRRQRLPLDTSSQFTPRRRGQSGPRTHERRSRPRLPRNSVKLVKTHLRRERFPLDTSSQLTPRGRGQRGPKIQEGRSRPIFPRISAKLLEPNFDDNGSHSIFPLTLLREALARDAPKLRNGALV